jgi:PAS domain S-box-containing protein
VLATVLEEVRCLLGIVACSVWLLDRENGELVCQEATGLRSKVVRGWRLALGEGILGWVAQSGESLIVSDVRTDERHFKDIDRQTGLKLRAILALPLQVKQRMIGVLQVLDDKPGRFTTADLPLLEPLAASAAVAIENARLYQLLQTSEKMFRDLFENVPLCVFEVDLERISPIIVRANRRAKSVYGWSAEEITSASLAKIIPFEATPNLDQIKEVLGTGEIVTLEAISQRRDGATFPARIIVSSETPSSLKRVIVTVQDITIEKSRRSEEEAIAEERRRIAREIHDGLAQDLAFLRLRARLWHNLIDQDPTQMHVELDELRAFLSEKIRDVRRSIFALRPVALDELGFFPALRQFANDFGEQNQVQVTIHISGSESRLPVSLEPVLFRIIQEALHNVGKHAQASMASVELHIKEANAVTLTVRDDGVGFDPTILDQAAHRGHLGLTQMRERVEALEGTLTLQSQARKGVQIRVTLPPPKE